MKKFDKMLKQKMDASKRSLSSVEKHAHTNSQKKVKKTKAIYSHPSTPDFAACNFSTNSDLSSNPGIDTCTF